MPNKSISKSDRVNSKVSPDAKQSLITIADKHYSGNQTAALNSILLHVGLTQIDEPMQFQTWYGGRWCQAYARPEVILGGNGWANIKTPHGLVSRYHDEGHWTMPDASDELDEGRF